MNNPTVATFASKISADLPAVHPLIGTGFEVRVWNIPRLSGRPRTETITWEDATRRADGWMEVRHCLTHGLVSGWRSEIWPAPLRGSTSTPASAVLRARAGGKHSIGLTGAIACARIYTSCARHVAELAAREIGQSANWTSVAEFPLHRADQTSSEK